MGSIAVAVLCKVMEVVSFICLNLAYLIITALEDVCEMYGELCQFFIWSLSNYPSAWNKASAKEKSHGSNEDRPPT